MHRLDVNYSFTKGTVKITSISGTVVCSLRITLAHLYQINTFTSFFEGESYQYASTNSTHLIVVFYSTIIDDECMSPGVPCLYLNLKKN